MAFNRIIIGLLFVGLATSCSHKKPAPETPPPPPVAETPTPEPTPAPTPEPPPAPVPDVAPLPFAYEGDKGPDHWASLNPDWAVCAKGKHQSPINLTWKKPGKKAPRVDFSYNSATAQLETNGILTLKMTGANQLLLEGKVYSLDRVEFHSPSEHTLSKTGLTMEIELIHKAVEGEKMAVVSIFAIEGQENPLFTEIWNQVTSPSAPFEFDASRMIPPNRTFYRYQGSLTTPPCTEGVEWVVFNTPMELSKAQIEAYRSKFTPNNRPIQSGKNAKVSNY